MRPPLWLRLVGVVLFWPLIVAIVGELTLQLVAATSRVRLRASHQGPPVEILCVGDSHTYGLGVKAWESYPGQLASAGVVVNAGIPGTNSAQLRARLGDWLLEHEPFYVVILVGVNNLWNRASPEFEPNPLWNFRLYKAFRKAHSDIRFNIRRRAYGATVEWITAGGDTLIRHTKGANEPWRLGDELYHDLLAIAKQCRDRNAHPIFLTYAAGGQYERTALVNKTIRAVARGNTFDLVDPAVHFDSLGLGNDYYIKPGDPHPNAEGYREIAALVATAIGG